MRSQKARPLWLRVPWVARRSCTTKRNAYSAKLLVGPIAGVVMKVK